MRRVVQTAAATVMLLCPGMFASRLSAQTSAQNNSGSLEREFQAAMAAQDAGDLDQAEAMLVSLRARHPGIFAVDESLGLIYVAREKYAAALPILEAAAREAPGSDVAHANLGAAYYKLHRNSDALKAFETAARLNPQNASTQESLGRLWMEMHQPVRAAEAFAAAIALKPGDSDLVMARAQALLQAGQFTQAREQLDAIPDANHSAAAQSLLGDVDEKAGDFRNAAEHYARAVELDPSEQNVWALGADLLRHWTFDPAIKEFEAAVVKFPHSAQMKLGLGTAFFGAGNYERAIQVYSALLASDKDNALYAQLLGVACSTAVQGDRPQCGALIPYALAHPRDAKTAVHAASWLQAQAPTAERMETARKLLNNAIAADPQLAEAQYQMGVLLQKEEHWQQSRPYLEAAVKLDNTLPGAHYRLGLVYYREERKQEAAQQMDLYMKYRQQELANRDRKLSGIMTLVVSMHN